MSTIVLAYSGGFVSSLAAHWLSRTHDGEVVTVTLDLGQGDDLAALRARALSCGVARAHVLDAREDLARQCLLPSLDGHPLGGDRYPLIGDLARPLVARTLVDIARIEATQRVAHVSRADAFDTLLHAIDPGLDIRRPAQEWNFTADDLVDCARRWGVPVPAAGHPDIEQNLWGRMTSWTDVPGSAGRPRAEAWPAEPASLAIGFTDGVPTSVNGVALSPAELVESLALIAGRHGVGQLQARRDGRYFVYDAPAALVLHAAHAAARGRSGVVALSVVEGHCTVVDAGSHSSNPELVNHA